MRLYHDILIILWIIWNSHKLHFKGSLIILYMLYFAAGWILVMDSDVTVLYNQTVFHFSCYINLFYFCIVEFNEMKQKKNVHALLFNTWIQFQFLVLGNFICLFALLFLAVNWKKSENSNSFWLIDENLIFLKKRIM